MSRRCVPALCCSLLATLLALPGQAAERQSLEAINEVVRQFVQAQLASYGERASFQLGRLDNRLQLAACAQLDPQLPKGSRLLGNTSVSVRCVKGARWTVSVPVAVSIQSEYWVTARPLPAGHEISAADLEKRSGDLSQISGNVIADPAQAIGRNLVGGAPAGAPLRAEMLRASFAVRANDFVRVIAHGSGFEVATEGRALANAAEGQQVSVRMNSGAVVQGIARADGSVEIKY
ncbi:flagellar basal body P-ring formation chaperone FlgA [Chitinimonas lacunae]|uniref:Flagella basal body P-ring formation protein FlgA n=1 Tax=Chitinimonas lacunae TaxID=1963018 RepID=A0ABV8MNT1_9NEIS